MDFWKIFDMILSSAGRKRTYFRFDRKKTIRAMEFLGAVTA
jgi:hypothetical protein